MISFLFIKLLSKKWYNIYIRPFFDINYKIKHFNLICRFYWNSHWLKWCKKLSYSTIYGCKCKFLYFKSLNRLRFTFFNFSSQLMIYLFSMSWSLLSFTYCQNASKIAILVPFFMPTILCKEDSTWNFGGLLIKLNLIEIPVSSLDFGNFIKKPSCYAKLPTCFFHYFIIIKYCFKWLTLSCKKEWKLFKKRSKFW